MTESVGSNESTRHRDHHPSDIRDNDCSTDITAVQDRRPHWSHDNLDNLESILEDDGMSVDEHCAILSTIARHHRRSAVDLLTRVLTEADLDDEDNDKEVWTFLPRLRDSTLSMSPTLRDEIAEACLDWAIASKRARQTESCVLAHLCRIALCPRYEATDAVRLLGVPPTCSKTKDFAVQEIPMGGIFERVTQLKDQNAYHASEGARQLGQALHALFSSASYSFQACCQYLVPLMEEEVHANQLIDANCFFRHRHDLAKIDGRSHGTSDDKPLLVQSLDVLVRLFLFGVTVSKHVAHEILGEDAVQLLVRSELLQESAANNEHLAGVVQIFPIGSTDLFAKGDSQCFFFMTDWPMESLRATQSSVMSVGYDTLELMSLTADGVPRTEQTSTRLLDLCCGCGIQGIFAFTCSGGNGYKELLCTDINRRACCFAAANMALNQIGKKVGRLVEGDLYEHVYGVFGRIVCNPPFVAIPSYSGSPLAPALYAVGGGADGTEVLSQVVAGSMAHLDSDGSLLMVTEVPNIESSCELLLRFLNHKPADVRIAYVASDVETVEEYAAVRQEESGVAISGRDWAPRQTIEGVRNRALALISISHGDNKSLFCYAGDTPSASIRGRTGDESPEEEDAFLTEDGIRFNHSLLL